MPCTLKCHGHSVSEIPSVLLGDLGTFTQKPEVPQGHLFLCVRRRHVKNLQWERLVLGLSLAMSREVFHGRCVLQSGVFQCSKVRARFIFSMYI